MKQPNLLVIHTDEHNFRTLGCYRDTLPATQAFVWGGDAVLETPNIDWLAKQGALCTSFYATTPLCSPSRASFVSGQYPQSTGVVKNGVPLNDDIVTFAEILRRKGYRTGYVGKWHLDGAGKPQWAPERRFGFEDNRYMYNRGHWKKLADTAEGPTVDTPGKPSYDVTGATAENFTTDWLTAKAIEFLENDSEGPFCCMLSIPDPHAPDSVRAPYDTQYAGMRFEAPRTAGRDPATAPSWARPTPAAGNMSQYFGMVKCIDDNVGRLIDCLRSSGRIDDTIVVFTSDHGDMCGEHNRQHKQVPLDASVKVPFIVFYPARIVAGTVVKHALGMPDFLPTILSLMDIAADDGRPEGRDASALFTGGEIPPTLDDLTFARGSGLQSNWLAAFTSRYKLIFSPEDPPWLLDREKDPDEVHNCCDDRGYDDIVHRLAAELIAYGHRYGDERIADPKMGPELLRLAQVDRSEGN